MHSMSDINSLAIVASDSQLWIGAYGAIGETIHGSAKGPGPTPPPVIGGPGMVKHPFPLSFLLGF